MLDARLKGQFSRPIRGLAFCCVWQGRCYWEQMKILTVSDKVDELLYSSAIKRLFSAVDLRIEAIENPDLIAL